MNGAASVPVGWRCPACDIILSPLVLSCTRCHDREEAARLPKPKVMLLVASYTRAEARQDPDGAACPVAYAVRATHDFGDYWQGPTLLNPSMPKCQWTKKDWRVVGRREFMVAHARMYGKPWPKEVRLPRAA